MADLMSTNSLTAQLAATPREKLADVRATEHKGAQEAARHLREVAKDAIRRVGKQGAAAIDIGIHEGRLAHKLSDGTISLAELEKLGPHYAAEFGRQLLERFGALATPQARARQKIREARQALDELDQFLEHIA
jgi:hypothetical protein